MSERGGRGRRRTRTTLNANANEEGSDTGTEGAPTPNVQEMFNQYLMNMMRNAPATIASGETVEVVGLGGVVQPPRDDFAKISKDFANLGGKTFSGVESVIEVQEWLDTCERIFGDLELEDAMKRKVASRQLVGRAMGLWNAIVAVTTRHFDPLI